jgi:serine/threonine protein kinase
VSTLVDGSSLQGHRLTIEDIPDLIAAVAETLHYAHTQNVFHRDVKPSNILISEEGRPYLVDFGLALKDEQFGSGPSLAGTWATAYASNVPQILREALAFDK